MARTTSRVAVALLAVGLAGAGVLAFRAPAAMQAEERERPKWEYKVINEFDVSLLGLQAYAAVGPLTPRGAITAGLNTLGADGWEMITVTSVQAPAVYHFKRPR